MNSIPAITIRQYSYSSSNQPPLMYMYGWFFGRHMTLLNLDAGAKEKSRGVVGRTEGDQRENRHTERVRLELMETIETGSNLKVF